ncbi:MAG: ribonuclease PH [Candidatus Midichloria sp.]|nr:ribonuclease PH [Candidatus Midichloria sp.]
MRSYNRYYNELRPVEIIAGYNKHAEGSCLIKFGETTVICTASLDEKVPQFLRNTGQGWVTAEYGMLPRSTGSRIQREATKGKQEGRTQEIQRLIGRSLRAAIDLKILGERQIIIDCDVIQADGGTRTAAITGGYIALCEAIKTMIHSGIIKRSPMKTQIAAVSCGIINGKPLLDLDYNEDSKADIDANFVFDGFNKLIEIQATGEKTSFNEEEFNELLKIAKEGTQKLLLKQRETLKIMS